INVPGMPAGIADILKYAELEAPPMEFHTAGRGRQRDAMAFHGTSEPTVTQKAAVRDLIRAVDNHVRPIVDAGSAPLVVAAVDYVQALYRESSSTKSLIDDRVTGNSDRLSNHQLAERARSPVLRQLASERREAAARYRELVNGPRSSDDAREILRAAHTGRVAELWVAEDAELWGTFDPGAGEMRTSADMAAHCDDLLDLAVVKTLENTGKVYAAALSEMPDPMPNNSPMAAAFRWP
ncbi:MAG: hypothetical protein HY682_04635, partial [Chloroflexi bacterium]|nr:hypothetical protein [Chloroflexota bacterium]